MGYLRYIFFALMLANLQLGIGQEKSNHILSPEDYGKWSTLYGEQLAGNGKWYSYTLGYKQQIDTLFVRSVLGKDIFPFPNGVNGQFAANNNFFACQLPEKGMVLVDLKIQKAHQIAGVKQFEFSKNGDFLVIYGDMGDKRDCLKLYKTEKYERGPILNIEGVTEFNLEGGLLAYITDNSERKGVYTTLLVDTPRPSLIAENFQYKYKTLSWNPKGTALVFFQEQGAKDKGYKIYHWEAKSSALNGWSPTYGSKILDTYITDNFLKVSEDGKVVFFNLQETKELALAEKRYHAKGVQLWKSKDRIIYPQRRLFRGWEYGPKKTAWWPGDNRTQILESDTLPTAIISATGKYMLSFDPHKYGPHFKKMGNIDLYLTDLKTGHQTLFLKNQHWGQTFFSPGGNFISYFKDSYWWLYDFKKKERFKVNLAKEKCMPLGKIDPSGRERPFGAAGWTRGDAEFLIYTEYDVLAINPEKRISIVLTDGREEKITYRVPLESQNRIIRPKWFREFELAQFDQLEGLTFSRSDAEMATGYSTWHQNKGNSLLLHKNMKVDRLLWSKDNKSYIVKEQSFDISPRLCFWNSTMKRPTIILETNCHQHFYDWGKSELLHYKGPNGEVLQGALFYPSNYKPGAAYPMIVDIYENMSRYLHQYINPSEFMETGFNPTNYTLNGYFVFYPDIKYRVNDPGNSALDCVVAGVKAVLDLGVTEKGKLGLNGHSFGGYETAFINSRTNLFSAAVAGSAVTDLISFYHSIGWVTGKSEMWRFEDDQFRYDKDFSKNPSAYYKNSPMHQVGYYGGPMLLWTGDNDYWVNWNQSIEQYLALRRLERECDLLVYPDEAHTLLKPQNQQDLTRRISAWFKKHLQ